MNGMATSQASRRYRILCWSLFGLGLALFAAAMLPNLPIGSLLLCVLATVCLLFARVVSYMSNAEARKEREAAMHRTFRRRTFIEIRANAHRRDA